MAGEVISQEVAQRVAQNQSGLSVMDMILIGIAISFVLVLIYVIYKAIQKRAEYADAFLKDYNYVRELCLQQADARLFSGQFRNGGNARLFRNFEENGKYERMNLGTGPTHYMGHMESKQGVIFIAFSNRKSFMLFPVTEVLMAPLSAVQFHYSIGQITIKCSSLDRLNKSMYFVPVYKTAKGEILKDAFSSMQVVWEERLSADFIKEQGTAVVELANRLPSLNPNVQYNRKNRPVETE